MVSQMDVSAFLDIRAAPQVLFAQLPERAEQIRFQVALADGSWRPVTWQAFADEVRNVALDLAQHGLQPGDRAAIFAGNSVQWLAAALGIQAAGGVMVPIYPSCTADQAAYVLEHSDSKVVFVDGVQLGQRILCGAAWPMLQRVIALSKLELTKIAEENRGAHSQIASSAEIEQKNSAWAEVQKHGEALHPDKPLRFAEMLGAISVDAPGLMLYTSGTSGPPKGVPLSHRNIGVNGRDWLICLADLLEPGMTDLLWLPMSHIFGFGQACLGNTLGFTSWLCEPAQVLQKLPIVRPSVFMSVPSLWEKFAMTAQAAGDVAQQKAALAAVTGGNLKFCLSGGAGLKQEIKTFLHSHGLLVIEGYGLTECSPTLTLNRPDAFRFDSVGLPLPSLELRLGADGEILARGPNIFSGYHKDSAATAQCFTEDGWLRTGDIGRFTHDGFLQIVDRKKDILVTAGGKNVAPANIELQFRDDPVIAFLVVYGDGKNFLSAGVWPWPHVAAAKSPEELASLVAERIAAVNGGLARHETIKKWHIFPATLTIEDGQLTPTLKVKRKFVVAQFLEHFEALYAR